MAKKYHLRDVAQLRDRGIFFDANVLIYLFWPTGQHFFEQNYACVFRNLLRQGNRLYVDFLVISEVINRILRIEHQKTAIQRFKDFRNSQEGKDALTDIYLVVKNSILSRFEIIGKAFDNDDIETFLVLDDLDFIDKALVTLCNENSLVLLTNDKDFENADVDILTGNPNYFRTID